MALKCIFPTLGHFVTLTLTFSGVLDIVIIFTSKSAYNMHTEWPTDAFCIYIFDHAVSTLIA